MCRREFLQSLGVVAASSFFSPGIFAATPFEHALQELDRPTSLEFVDTPLKDVVEYLSGKHRVPIRILRDTYAYGNILPDQPITKYLHSLSLRSTLNLLADDLLLDYRVTERGEVFLFTAEKNAAAQRPVSAVQMKANERNRVLLEKTKVSLEFVDTPFKDVIGFAAEQADVTMVLDRHALDAVNLDADKSVSANIRDVPLHRALTALLFPFDLGVAVRDEVMVITARDPHGPRRPVPEFLRRAALAPVHVELLDPPLHEALAQCAEQADVYIHFDHRRMERAGISIEAKVTGPLPKLPLRDALHQLLKPLGLRARVYDEVLFITPVPEKLPK